MINYIYVVISSEIYTYELILYAIYVEILFQSVLNILGVNSFSESNKIVGTMT